MYSICNNGEIESIVCLFREQAAINQKGGGRIRKSQVSFGGFGSFMFRNSMDGGYRKEILKKKRISYQMKACASTIGRGGGALNFCF